MKFWTFFLFFITTVASSQVSSDCNQLGPFDIPDCASEENIAATENGDFQPLCSCKDKFDRSTSKFNIPQGLSKKKKVKDILKDQLEKFVSKTMIDIATIRSLYNLDGNFESAIKECSIQDNLQASCLSSSELNEFKSDLSLKFSNELGKILNPVVSYKNHDEAGVAKSIFDRSQSRPSDLSCNFSDIEVLQFNTKFLEISLADDPNEPTLIEKISQVSPVTMVKLLEVISSHSTMPEYNSLIGNHPLLARLITQPEMFKGFFQGIQKPITTKSFQSSLYKFSPESVGGIYLKDLAKSCHRVFKDISSGLCPGDKIKISKMSLPNGYTLTKERSFNDRIILDESRESDSNLSKISAMDELLKVCDIRDPNSNNARSKDSIDLTKIDEEINKTLPPSLRNQHISSFRIAGYGTTIGDTRKFMCESQKKCPPNGPVSNECKAIKSLEEENTLTRTSDPRVNSLLRSLIGNPAANSLPPETSRVLISQGIIPSQEGGQVVDTTGGKDRTFGDNFGRSVSSRSNGTTSLQGNGQLQSPSNTRASAARIRSFDTAPTGNQNQSAEQLIDSFASDMRNKTNLEAIRSLREGIDDLAASSSRGTATTPRSPQGRQQGSTTPQQQGPTSATALGSTIDQRSDVAASGAPASAPSGSRVDLDNVQDPRQVQARENLNRALADMDAKNQRGGTSAGGSVGATGAASREPASTAAIERSSDGTIAITVNPSKVYQELVEQLRLQTPESREILNQIAALKNFNFKLNGNQVSAEFRNGSYVVNGLSGPMKSEVERFLNELKTRANLSDLNRSMQQTR